MINDIKPVEVEGLREGFRGLMFADDTVIAAENRNDLVEKLEIIEKWMESNSMELNPSKCGIMLVKADQNESVNFEPIFYKGEIIPILNSYIYLGINFNDKLDLDVMSRYRVQKGIEKSKIVSLTLRNKLVPLEYKKMLVNNIIIPTVSYGTEIFGMSEKRTQGIKKVIDISLSHILNTKNFCRNRAYEEFDLKSIHMKAAINRTRAFRKWKESKNLISDLIRSSEIYKSRKSTWSKGTNLWLKRFKIDINNPLSNGKQEIMENYIPRIMKRDKTETSKLARILKVKSGKLLRRLEINMELKPLGVYNLMRLRTGTFMFTNKLTFIGILSHTYKDKCICCKANIKEEIGHILLECNAFKNERDKYLEIDPGDRKLAPDKLKNKNLNLLLGGERPASGKMQAEKIVKTIDYLSAIARKRAALIAEAIREPL